MKTKIFILLTLTTIFLTGCADEKLRELQPRPEHQPQELAVPDDLPDYDKAALRAELERTPAATLQKLGGNVVTLPAVSRDFLSNAIAAAGPGGTVLLKAGDHHESGTVVIDQPVTIIGERGAKLISDVAATTGNAPLSLEPALHIRNARGVTICGLDMKPQNTPGGTAILIQDAPHTYIRHNDIEGFQFGIVNEQGDHSRFTGNYIFVAGGLFNAHGIINVNGDEVWITGNEVHNAVFGVWACDKDGIYTHNRTTRNYIGLILCNVPFGALQLPNGKVTGSETPGARWRVQSNTSSNNLNAGYMVIDGATRNYLKNNRSSGNGTYDIELVGDSERFGFFTPTSSDNLVWASSNMTVKDCGEDNFVWGGQEVDTSTDPCF